MCQLTRVMASDASLLGGARRVCRHADVSMVKGDEESLASSLQSIRFSHPCVKWVTVFSGVCPSVKEPEFGHSRCNFRAHSSPCVDTCISLLRDKWPTLHVVVFLEVSSAQSQFATFADFKSRMDCICFDASSFFCPMERLRTFHISPLVRW